MPNKPIIEIDIDSSQFKEFYSIFKDYQDDLEKMPDDWKVVNESARKGAKALSAALGASVEHILDSNKGTRDLVKNIRAATEAQRQFGHASRAGEKALKNMAHDAKSVASSVFGIGKFMFKAAAWGTGLFAGSLFGVNKLAESAVGNQRSARGLGLSTGQFRAFGTDLGRYSDNSTLSAIANAKNDYQGRVMLGLATGLSASEVANMDAGTLAGRLAQREHDLWKSTPAAQRPTLAMLPQYKYLGQTTEDFYRSGAASSQELSSARAQYAKDAASLNIDKQRTNALYTFTRQLTLAGQKLETALTNKLSTLGPALGSFVTKLEEDAEILINSVLTPANLKAIGDGLKTFAEYLGSAEFRNAVKGFVQDIGKVMSVFHSAASLLPDSTKDETKAFWSGTKSDYNYAPRGEFLPDKYKGPYYGYVNPKNPDYANNMALFGKYEKEGNLPKGLIAAVVRAESSGDPNAISPAGAQGLMQLMPATAKQYGVTNPYDPGQNLLAGSAYYRDLFAHYKNQLPSDQLKMAVAAYNWGPGNVDKDIRTNKLDWEKHLPKETQDYMRKVLGELSKSAGKNMNITITNKSGTNVAVSTNAAGL